MMRSTWKTVDILLSLTVLLPFIPNTAKSNPLDGGYGGVYNSPEANAYWARRFGTSFFKSSSSRNPITNTRSFIGVKSVTPSFRLKEADRKNLYNPLEETLSGNIPDTKINVTKRIRVDLIKSSSSQEDTKEAEEKGLTNLSAFSKTLQPLKREKILNRPIKTRGSNSRSLKKKYLKKYFSSKNA